MSTKTLVSEQTQSMVDQLVDIRRQLTIETAGMSFSELKVFLSGCANVFETHGSASVDRSFLESDINAIAKQKVKSYDCVAETRKIRDQFNKETQNMTNEELRKHLDVKPSLFPGVGEK